MYNITTHVSAHCPHSCQHLSSYCRWLMEWTDNLDACIDKIKYGRVGRREERGSESTHNNYGVPRSS